MIRNQSRKSNRLGDAVWASMRDEYITGNESYAALAKRHGVGPNAVERHALDRGANGGKTWGELRYEFREEVSHQTKERTASAVAMTLARAREKAAAIAERALERLAQRLNGDEHIEDRDLIQIAKLAMAVKVEVSGDPDSAPIHSRVALDALTVDELRRLAERL